MTDRQTLLLALAVIYGLECLFWVRRGGVVFRRWWGPRWRVSVEGEIARNDNGDLHWATPLLNPGAVHVCREPALSLSRQGVLAFVPGGLHPGGRPLHTGRFVAWTDVRQVSTMGKTLLVNGELVWRGDSVHEPLRLGRLVKELVGAREMDREARIQREIERSFDATLLNSRRDELAVRCGSLRGLGGGLFLFLFVFCPLVIVLRGWLPALWFLVPALLAQTVAISVLFTRVHRHLFPDANEERFKLALICALAPVSAIRALDLLSRPLLESFHPLAAASVLLDREDFERFAQRIWRDLRFPRLPDAPAAPPAAVETAHAFHRQLTAAAESLLRSKGVDLESWLKPPPTTDPTHVRYCPRCEAQFTAGATGCADCGGRPLLNL